MTAKNYDVIKSLDSLRAFTEKLLNDGKPIGFDIETGYYGPDRVDGSLFCDWDEQFIVGFSLTNDPGMARYVPLNHDFGNMLPEAKVWEIMKPVLETLPVVAHNMKFEKRNVRALLRKTRGPAIEINSYGDSMLQSYVLSTFQFNGLKPLVERIFNHKMTELKELFPNAKQKDMSSLRFNVLDLTPQVIEYACEDAAWCLALHDYFAPIVATERAFMYSLEMRIMDLLCDLEDAGHEVDWKSLGDQEAIGYPFHEQMSDAARKGLAVMSGEDESKLNLNSNKQMAEVLYERIGLSTTVMTKGGKSGEKKMSTGAIALEGLSREHPAIKKILETREVLNLAGRLKKWKNEYSLTHDKRVHANFKQHVVGSGRFSAADPSVQQLPKDWRWSTFLGVDPYVPEYWAKINEVGTFGKHYWQGNFRDFLVAGPDCYLLGYDYSQIELRCMAGMSQEASLLEAFNSDQDVHTLTAAMMLKMPVEDVDPDRHRPVGKTMNFALLYGMGEKSLGERLAIPQWEAEALYAQYFEAFTEVTAWMNDMKKFGWQHGYIETHFKRKWTIWESMSNNRMQLSKAERMFVNGPVQGTAADYMKIAMLRAKAALIKRGWWMTHVRMINNLHDALTFEVNNEVDPNELRELLAEAVVWRNESISMFPKIVADWEIGQRWGSAAKWKSDEAFLENGLWVVPAPVKKPKTEPAPEDVAEPFRAVIVEIEAMPNGDSFGRFLDMLKNNPGECVVTLRTPQGEVDLEKYPTDPYSVNKYASIILPGATVRSGEGVSA